jgi:predicted TIM-barrel fold metal-dependent hydrolase
LERQGLAVRKEPGTMRIDFHSHAFADKIAQKAVEQLITYYRIPTAYDGTLLALVREAVKAKLDVLVLLVAATKASQVKPANDWAIRVSRYNADELNRLCGVTRAPRLVPFGTFHPDDPFWQEEIRRLRLAGCRGIKLHPEFQGIDLADPRLNPFFEEISPDFIVVFHMGDKTKSPDNFSAPRKLAAILERFPKLKAVAAHMGGFCCWEESLNELAGRKVYFDTSSTVRYADRDLLKKIVAKHGTDRILFGSDFPLQSPAEAYAELESLDFLSASQKEDIAGKNAAVLLGL